MEHGKSRTRVNEALERSIIDWSQTHPKEMDMIGKIINRKSGSLSLRKIDYFITIYSQKYTVLINNPLCPNDKVDVYGSYKDVLKCFHKNYFDPFCRVSKFPSAGSRKIPLPVDRSPTQQQDEIKKVPAICQVNFFRWAFSMGIIKLAKKYSQKISEDMMRSKLSSKSPSLSSNSNRSVQSDSIVSSSSSSSNVVHDEDDELVT